MQITYTPHGAAQKVPGSKHLLEILRGDTAVRILTDCGIEYGHGRRDPELKFSPKTLDAVLFTHGHADHVGELPSLMAKGYAGKFYSTGATKDIVRQQLLTEQRHSQWKAEKNNRNPRFRTDDVARWMRQFDTHGYREPVTLAPGVRATFYDAGHIIGSSQILYEVEDEQGRWTKILMSGDLGRLDHDTAFIRHPDTGYPKDVDYVLMESTRGGQVYPSIEDSRQSWEDIIKEAYARKSRVICGAFSIMRTQLILDDLYRLHQQGKIPADFPIFLDSPSAVDVNGIIRGHPECYDAAAAQELARQGDSPFDFPGLRYVKDREDSKRINKMDGPLLVIAASGMWEHGRVIHHLEQALDDPEAILVQTGYQAKGTLGRKLQEGSVEHPKVKIFNVYRKYKAQLRTIHGYSGHADINDITKHLQGTHAKGIFLVHGEKTASEDAARALAARGHPNVIVPDRYREYVLDGQNLKRYIWTP